MSSGASQHTMAVLPPVPLTISLKAEVEAAVMPYTSFSGTVPPFSVAEIMVMAWVCRGNQDQDYICDRDMSDWIFLTFGYYKDLAMKKLYIYSYQKCSLMSRDKGAIYFLTDQRQKELGRFEMPLLQAGGHGPRSFGSRYTATVASCQQYLRRKLRVEPETFTRFFKLPPEIRLMIYEYALRFPADGLDFDYGQFVKRSKATPPRTFGLRDCTKFARLEMESSFHKRHLVRRSWTTELTPQILALLQASRQIHHEAMPVFFSTNHFRVSDLHDLTRLLRHCGARRRKYFTSISFEYNQNVGVIGAKNAFTLLGQAQRLNILEMRVREDSLVTALTPVADIKGMQLLSSLRVQELRFPIPCPQIALYLRERMLRQDDDPAEATPTKKKSAKKARKGSKKQANGVKVS